MITLEYPDYYFITVYTPNSQNELARLDYRMKWEEDFLAYLKKLEETKPVIFCGDLNGNVSMNEEWNVNGSYAAIEGITSPDGRVLGKMAHSERRKCRA